ncbi:transglutaminase domain-containing protein [Paenibacillus sp. 1001270B_150601_E10]|uniref:transglutaminase domain-containing protein n=1 Tax=Paenibacillus sp. 1001270B_150601_E10 TaxID=2787079 RepID=UPI001E5130E5|nr:transglutaminase-like domain-containing protein [Paenibacillus sp. 1001270B_150601_E10]
MQHLFFTIIDVLLTVLSLYVSYQAAQGLSPIVADWIKGLGIASPDGEMSWWQNLYYTVIISMRDLAMLRFAVLFLLLYLLIRSVAGGLVGAIFYLWSNENSGSPRRVRERGSIPAIERVLSRVFGVVLGAITGCLRILLVVVLLFGFVTLNPGSPISRHIQQSNAYQLAAGQVIEPFAGEWVTENLPVFTAEVKNQLTTLMQRRYEVIDMQLPKDIELAAKEVTKGAGTDEKKARLLYDWVGSRVTYDWDKANNYIEQGIWKEQTPQDTFDTKKGVCIDYARLYALMARAVGLEVRVVTGLGYDGRGGYGPHAWNTVNIDGKGWIPLDATWASTGDWFNPPNFDSTHIPDQKAASDT